MSHEPNAAAAAVSAATGGLAMTIDSISLAIFGVPAALWVACFSGAVFGVTWFPPQASVSRVLAVFTNALAGAFMTGLVISQWQLAHGMAAGCGFLIASAPLYVVRWLRARFMPGQHVEQSKEGGQ